MLTFRFMLVSFLLKSMSVLSLTSTPSSAGSAAESILLPASCGPQPSNAGACHPHYPGRFSEGFRRIRPRLVANVAAGLHAFARVLQCILATKSRGWAAASLLFFSGLVLSS